MSCFLIRQKLSLIRFFTLFDCFSHSLHARLFFFQFIDKIVTVVIVLIVLFATVGGFCTSCGSTLCKQNKGITGLCCPTDISGSANTIVKLYVSSKILNIKTTRTGPNDDGDSLCRAALPAKVPVELIPHTLAVFAFFRSAPPTKK